MADKNDPVKAQLLALLDTPSLADLGPGPRPAIQSVAVLNKILDRQFSVTHLAASAGELIRATVLLWHDHLDEAHSISQHIETPDGSYLHGIMHRREPDYGNARYWFRRVGRHTVFSKLAEQAAMHLASSEAGKLLLKLVVDNQWDSLTFVDLCEDAAKGDVVQLDLLRQIQAAEFRLLIAYFCDHA